MKRCCVILLLLVALCGQAQSPKAKPKVTPPDSVHEVYKDHLLIGRYEYRNGQKNGEFSELFYSSGGELIYKEEGKFKNGLKQGRTDVYTVYHDYLLKGPGNHYIDGKAEGPNQIMLSIDTMMNGNFSHGRLNGIGTLFIHYKIFDGTGLQYSRWRGVEECQYKNGLKHGVCFINDEYTDVMMVGMYKDGLKDSVWVSFVTQGEFKDEVMTQINYVKGLRQGPAESFYESYRDTLDGDTVFMYRKINEYAEFKDDLLHGEYILSTNNGVVIESGHYVEGMRQGQWRIAKQYEDELVYWHGNVVDNKMEGEWLCYDSKKRLRIKAVLNNDQFNGKWLMYDVNGTIVLEKILRKNRVIAMTNYEEMEKYSSITIALIDSLPMHLQVKMGIGYYSSKETYRFLGGDTIPVLDTIATQYLNLRNGLYNDTFLKLDGQTQSYSHDTLVYIQNYKMGHVHGEQAYTDYKKGVKLVRYYNNDTLYAEYFYTLDGRPYKGTYEFLTESPPNREVVRVRKGRRHGYTDIYGRLTGRLIGRVKYNRHTR